MSGLELLRQRIRERLTKTGLSANEASRRAGLGLSYVNDLLVGKSKNPVQHRLAQLAEVLECDLNYLLGKTDTPKAAFRVVGGTEVKSSSSIATPAAVEVPVYSVGESDLNGFFTLDEKNPLLVHVGPTYAVPNAYGVIVPDDSNAPRYFAGEMVLTSPGRPVSRGGFAVVRMKDGRMSIRRVDAILSDRVVVSRLEGGEPVELPRDEIEGVHRIIGTAEAVR